MLKDLLLHSWKSLMAAAIAGVISGVSGAALIMLINRVYAGSSDLVGLGILFFVCCLVHAGSKTTATIILMRVGQSMIYHLRIRLSRKLLWTPLKLQLEIGKSGLMAILTRDIEVLVSMSQIAPAAAANLIVILTCLSYIAWLSWQLFLFIALSIFLGGVAFHFSERTPLLQLEKVRDLVDSLYSHFRDLIEGSRELKLDVKRGEYFIERVISPSAALYKRSFSSAMARYAWVENCGDVAYYVMVGLLLFVLPALFPSHQAELTASALTVLYLVSPISMLIGAMPELRQVAIAARRIQKIDSSLHVEENQSVRTDGFETGQPASLELREIRHSYRIADEDDEFHLGPINFTLQPGSITFIVGGNGSGKTTLALILLGLYQADEGEILLNGKRVDTGNIVAYRQHFAAVFSDFHLFRDLMEEPSAEIVSSAQTYLAKLHLAHKVRIADGRFSTIDLSTGQRKRLALLSAYLSDRPIYLFDEWAADQDPAFKSLFYRELLPEFKAAGKIVIAITHDDAYFQYADSIIKLESGAQELTRV